MWKGRLPAGVEGDWVPTRSALFLLCTADTPHGPAKPHHPLSVPEKLLEGKRGKEEGSPKYSSLILSCWLRGIVDLLRKRVWQVLKMDKGKKNIF